MNIAMAIAMDMDMDMPEFRVATSAKIQSDPALLKRIAGDPDSRTEQEKQNDDMIKVILIKKLNAIKNFTLDQLCIQLQRRFKNLEGLSISCVDAAPAAAPADAPVDAAAHYLRKNTKINHIPESICGFSKLRVLCLRGPIITLPENLGNLTNLTVFRLDALGINADPNNEEIQRRAPILLPESIGTLENLHILNCMYCNLQVMPSFISRLSKLHVLTIDNSNLESLPESIGNLTNLTKLSLNRNKLTTLPDTCRELTNLNKLILSYNQFESITESMTDLSSLQTLNLSHNHITALPDNINKLTQLTYLYLDNNALTTLPDNFGIGNNHPMVILNLSYNRLTSIPVSVGNLRNLEQLNLNNNQHLRILPAEVLNLSRLGTEIFLHGTGIEANVQLPQGARINALEVHKEFGKIDITSLFIFFTRTVPLKTLESELRTFDKTRVVATLRSYIVRIPLTEAEQKQLLDRLRAIYNDRLDGYRYEEDDKKVISYCMAYVAAQPERFQNEYARAFVDDCYDAYGNGSVSCVKGVIERFVSTLRLAALLYDGTPEYNSRQYGDLVSIIGHKKIGSLKEHMNLISQDCYGKSQNNDGNADVAKYRNCMTETLKTKLGNQFNEKNSTTKNALNAMVGELNGMFGGRRVRRTHKKRRDILRKRTIKQKGKRKVRSTCNKKRTTCKRLR